MSIGPNWSLKGCPRDNHSKLQTKIFTTRYQKGFNPIKKMLKEESREVGKLKIKAQLSIRGFLALVLTP